jgi:hypothetical protein
MQYKVITDIREFKLLEPEWNLIFDRNTYSVFQSFVFNYYSWKEILTHSSSNSLFIIKIIQDNIAVGFFPLYNDKTNTLRFINDVHSDFCDLVLDKEIDLKKLFQFILNDCKHKKLQLINLKENSILTQFNAYQNQYNFSFTGSENYSDLEVDKGLFPSNCNKLLSKQKTEIRRIIKKNSNYKHEILSKIYCAFPINEILILKEKMIKNSGRNNAFLPLSQLTLIEKLYDNQYIEISLIKDNDVKAISFVLKNKNESMFWIDLYDDVQMVNLYNYISYISLKSADSKVCINFGRGAYSYKISNFAPEIRELYALYIFSSKSLKIRYIIKNYFLGMIRLLYRKFK